MKKRGFSPRLKNPLSVGGSNGFGDNIPPKVHILQIANQDWVGKAAWAILKGWVGLVGWLPWQAQCCRSLPIFSRPAECVDDNSSIHLSFSDALSARVTATMGNDCGTLSGEGRQQMVIFHPHPCINYETRQPISTDGAE